MGVIIIKEYSLSVNDFKEPQEYEDGATIFVLIKRLILLNPGTYPNHPDMGVGLIRYWRHSDMDETTSLETKIREQIETYLPQLNLYDVSLTKKSNNELAIIIKVGEITLAMETTEDDTLRLIDL